MQSTDIQNILAELTRSLGETPIEILPIAASGSARKYYRIVTDKRTLIGTYSENMEENEGVYPLISITSYRKLILKEQSTFKA